MAQLPVQKVVGDADQADDHIGGDRRVGMFDAFAEGAVSSIRNSVQFAKPHRVGVILGPFWPGFGCAGSRGSQPEALPGWRTHELVQILALERIGFEGEVHVGAQVT